LKKPYTHAHRYIRIHTKKNTHTCNKVKHVGIFFYRSMANFSWCACVCVLFTQKNATSYSNIKKHTNTL